MRVSELTKAFAFCTRAQKEIKSFGATRESGQFFIAEIDKTMQNAEEYANIIIRDERERIVSEKPTVYTDDKIERIYEFEDGAVIKYEWQSQPPEEPSEHYNHKFTLITVPAPNPNKFKTGVVKVINY